MEQAKSSAEREASKIKADSEQDRNEATAGLRTMKDKWQSHVADVHGKAADKKAEFDERKAEHKVESAENYADHAVSFAIAAVQEAEYAVLDAVLAGYDANTSAGTR